MVMLMQTVMAMVPTLRAFKNHLILSLTEQMIFISGTSAGRHYGVAQRASIIAVKVLSDGGYV